MSHAVARQTALRVIRASAVALWLTSSVVLAQESPDNLLRRGNTEFSRGEYREAIRTWTGLLDTVGVDRGWKILYNVGRARDALNEVSAAVRALQRFVREAQRRGHSAHPSVKDANERIGRIQRSHGAIFVASGRTRAMVRIGEGEAQPAGLVTYVLPGAHVIEFRPNTTRAESRVLTLVAGQRVRVQVPPLSAEAATASASKRPSPLPWIGLSGAAALSVALPVALNRRAAGLRESAAALALDDPAYRQAKRDFDRAKLVYQLSYAVPLTLAGAAGYLAYRTFRAKREHPVKVGFQLEESRVLATLEGRF